MKNRMKTRASNIFITLAACLAAASAQAGATFDAIKAKGFVQCGASDGAPGFSMLNSEGKWQGLDIETCRAIAAALFGDANKFKAVPLSSQQRFTALQSGEVDVLIRGTTLTQSRDTTLGLIGVGVNFYDSQGIMVARSMGIRSAKVNRPVFRGGCLVKVKQPVWQDDQVGCSNWPLPRQGEYTR